MNRRRIIALVLFITLVALVGLLAARWGARYDGQNPVTIEQAKAAIKQGRAYEVLKEDEVFMTDNTHFSELLHFIEGHYGVYMETFEADTVTFSGANGDMTFRLIHIQSFYREYFIWEKVN